MRPHVFKNKPEELLEEGLKIVESSSDSKFIHRVVMVNLMLSGKLNSLSLSKLSGISQRTLNHWITVADEEGFDRLKAIKQSGKPPRLNNDQLEEIKDALSQDPEKSGYRVWDGPSLSQFIKSKYAIELGVRQCQRLFHKLGFSLLRAQTFPSKDEQNEQQRQDLKKTQGHQAKSQCHLSFSR